jgi:hypothetical protein
MPEHQQKNNQENNQENSQREQTRALDSKGGPGHTVLLALALAVPAVKVAYTVGSAEGARDVFVGMEFGNWPDVLVGMVLTEPVLGAVLGVVVSRVVFALFAARGAVPKSGGLVGTARRLALTVANPLAVGILAACFYGPWWGLGTGLAAFALREGVVVEYRAGRRGHHHHDPEYRPPRLLRRFSAAEQWVAAALTVVVLPLTAAGTALDGRSWTSVLRCEVQEGRHTDAQRVIELGRKGNGVVGWSLDTEEVVNGAGCVGTGSLRVRDPWWE